MEIGVLTSQKLNDFEKDNDKFNIETFKKAAWII